jgi:hypothetical protein
VGGRVPTWDDLGQLPYLRAVLDETLRYHHVMVPPPNAI